MLRCHVCTAVHILLAINCFYICCVYKVDVIVISALTIKVSVKLIKDLLLLLLLFILISLRKMIIFLSLRRPRTKFSDTSMFLNRYGNNTTTFHHFNPVNLQFLFPFIRGSLHHIPQIIFAQKSTESKRWWPAHQQATSSSTCIRFPLKRDICSPWAAHGGLNKAEREHIQCKELV